MRSSMTNGLRNAVRLQRSSTLDHPAFRMNQSRFTFHPPGPLRNQFGQARTKVQRLWGPGSGPVVARWFHRALALIFLIAFWSLAEAEVQTFEANACPLCDESTHGPAVKPGSRPGAATTG